MVTRTVAPAAMAAPAARAMTVDPTRADHDGKQDGQNHSRTVSP